MKDFDFLDLMELIDKFQLDVHHICDLPANKNNFVYRIVFERGEVAKRNTNENIQRFCAELKKSKSEF